MLANYQDISNFLNSKSLLGNLTDIQQISLLSEALSILEENDSDLMVAVEHEMASLIQSYFVESRTMGVQFDEGDVIGWVKSFFTWWRGLVKHEWLMPAEPIIVGNKLRMGVFGDWGTGLYGAVPLAKSIEKDGNFDILVHLGDVYYSGTESEVKDRFLNFWPNTRAICRSCNSNHEMYTGGYGYFKHILPAFNQSSSCFAFKNDKWLIVGLDSAYHNFDFNEEQMIWLENIADRKIVLFTHNQPFSLLSVQGTKLVTKLGRLLEEKKIFAWYWGHEHRCVIYDYHPVLNFHGRCLGHAGYPYYRREGGDWIKLDGKNFMPGGLLLNMPNPYIDDRYGVNGYAVLEIEGNKIHEIYYNADGVILNEKLLVG